MPTTPTQKEHVLDNYLRLEINERRGLDSPKPSLLQSQFNRVRDVAPKGATRG